ncbi:MAG: histidine phosphatase family protein [Flavobacteriales bacterium]|nr:histidine phosphatase family protein [Flavobacteriales bacterium]
MTTIYVVRHAEKLDPADPDTPLSPEGEARARDLASTLARAGVQRIYATTRLRTQQTVAPLAQQRNLVPVILEPAATEELVARIKADDRGMVVVVAGHNNTVPVIVQGLSGVVVDGIPEDRFDRLFKVTIAPDGKATMEELRYGVPTP